MKARSFGTDRYQRMLSIPVKERSIGTNEISKDNKYKSKERMYSVHLTGNQRKNVSAYVSGSKDYTK